MGYRIMYSPDDDHKYPVDKPGKKDKKALYVILAAVILATAAIPRSRHKLEQWLIPGDAQVTKAAFSVMLDEIRTGEPVGEAVSAFCHEILDNGKSEQILSA